MSNEVYQMSVIDTKGPWELAVYILNFSVTGSILTRRLVCKYYVHCKLIATLHYIEEFVHRSKCKSKMIIW